MRVWVTRTGGEATATRLRALGHAPLIAPVLEVRPLACAIELEDIAALAVTSRNGLRILAERTARRDLTLFAVGEATAQAARDAGFADVRSADGDVEALAALIAEARPGLVLHAGAAEPAQDLGRLLRGRGVEARSQAIYETFALPLSEAVTAALTAEPPELDAILVHSPRGGARVAELLADHPGLAELDVLCISDAAAVPLQGLKFRQLRVAEFPNEASLLKLLDR